MNDLVEQLRKEGPFLQPYQKALFHEAADRLVEARHIFEQALGAIPDYVDGRNDPVVDSIEKWLRRTMK